MERKHKIMIAMGIILFIIIAIFLGFMIGWRTAASQFVEYIETNCICDLIK